MKQGKHFKRTAFNLSAKSMVSTLLLLIAMLMPQGAWAISGNGTASSPYLIANEADLILFQQYVEAGNSGIYGKLTADITLTKPWTRIGRADRRFKGNFDGQGHLIIDMDLQVQAYEHGFFGYVENATIKNLWVYGKMTTKADGKSSHGGVVGLAIGSSVIENVESSVEITINHAGYSAVGGVVGQVAGTSKVIGCRSHGVIRVNKSVSMLGGIIGYAQNNLTITDNGNEATMFISAECQYIGGIAGKTDGTIDILRCYSDHSINGGPSYDCLGGIVGYAQYQSKLKIDNCYNASEIHSESTNSGLVMGGIIGCINDEGSNFRGLTNCFSDGLINKISNSNPSTNVGGIAGVIKNKAVEKLSNNYYLSTSAPRVSGKVGSLTFSSSNASKTIEECKSGEVTWLLNGSAAGTIWRQYIGTGYPTIFQNAPRVYYLQDKTCLGAAYGDKHYTNNSSPSITHAYTTRWVWADDGKSATCYRTCSRSCTTGHEISAKVTLNNGIVEKETDKATCSKNGNLLYTATATFGDEEFTSTKNVATAKANHNYASPSWSWDETVPSAEVTVTCSVCPQGTSGHTTSVELTTDNGITTVEYIKASCAGKGYVTYTALVTLDGNTFTSSQNAYTDELPHPSFEGVLEWASSGTYAFLWKKCSVCHLALSYETAEVSNGRVTKDVILEPNCNNTGTTRYTVDCKTDDGLTYYSTNEVTTSKLGHSYDPRANWSWSDDYETCIYSIGCTRCSKETSGHYLTYQTLTLGNGIKKEVTQRATCIRSGQITYTASVTKPFVNNYPIYIDTPKLGHGSTGYKEIYVWNGYDNPYCTFQLRCGLCSETMTGATVSVSKVTENHIDAKCSEPGRDQWIAIGSYNSTGDDAPYIATPDIYNYPIPATGVHIFTKKTLTASPVEDGLYAYACDYGCGTHTDDHIIKDFNGAGNHLELTKDGEGNYSTSEDIILADANGFVSPVDFSAPSVTYTRTGIKNQFGTLVLPFDVNGMGADYDLYKLDQVFDYELVLRKVDKGDNGGIVPAGTPVLIRLHDDLDGNYDLTLTAASNAVSCQLAEGSKADGYQLVGTYETKELSADDYFISNNKFWSVGEMVYNGAIGVKTAPFRAYIHHSWAGAKAHTLSIRIADEDVTAVETLNALTEGNAEYYDMNGRRINSLQKGVNIVKYGNGKTIKVNIK